MALVKIPSVQMPDTNADGYTLGGNMWVSKKFKKDDPLTYDGIVIDPDGSYFGAENIGITVWKDAVKTVQISTAGMTIGAAGGSQITYDAATGLLTVPQADIDYLSTEAMIVGSITSGTGILFDSTGISGFKSTVKTFGIDVSTGDFIFGTEIGKQLIFDASEGSLTVGGSFTGTVATYLSTSQMAAGTPPVTGVVVDNAGIRAYASSVKTLDIKSNGDVVIGSATGNQLFYSALTGAMAIGELVSGTGVLINANGLSGYKSTVRSFFIDASTGDVSIGPNAGQQLKFTASTGIFQIPAIMTNIMLVGSAPGTGILFDSIGIAGYKSGVNTFSILASGSFTFGSTVGNQLMYDQASGRMAFGRIASGTGLLWDHLGIRGYKSGVKTFEVTTGGDAYFGGTLYAVNVASGYELTINDEFYMYASGTTLFFSNHTLGSSFWMGDAGATYQVVLNASDHIKFDCDGNYIDITPTGTSVSGAITVTGQANLNGTTYTHHLHPGSKDLYNLGNSNTDHWWKNIRVGAVSCNDLYFTTATDYTSNILSDAWDDLDLLDKIKYKINEKGEPLYNDKGENIVDIMSYPEHCLDFVAVAKYINEEISPEIEITIDEAKDIVFGKTKHETIDLEKLKEKVGLNFGSIRGLQIGAIRQLNKKVDTIIKEMSEWKNK